MALSTILRNLFFQDDVLANTDSSLKSEGFGTQRPVPNDTTHWIGACGHSNLASCIATAVGLLINIPPSCNVYKVFIT